MGNSLSSEPRWLNEMRASYLISSIGYDEGSPLLLPHNK